MASQTPDRIDEDARRRFEKARGDGPVALEEFLPPSDHPWYSGTLEELVHIEMEFAWKAWGKAEAGPRPTPVEAWLARFPTLRRPDCLRRLLEQEFRVRQRYGRDALLDRQEYQQRFPGLDLGGATLPLAPTTSDTPALPSLPGFEILGVLGRGAMGVVYKARQIDLDRVVALKMILAGAHADAEDLARFRSEAEAVARLQHPNIVQIHEVGDSDGLPYFVLEFVEGGTLAEKLAATPQPVRQAAGLVEVLARAVAFTHQRGIIHRDLKPANVLLAADGTPRIADFGLAKRLESDARQTATGAVIGTPSYMAPEQAAGNTRAVGPGADIYALGATLYELLTGRPPFRSDTAYHTLILVQTGEVVSPRRLQPRVPRDLEVICLKCLEKDPGQRYASALDLAEDLARFLRDEPIRARPIGPLQRFGRWCRRRPLVAGLTLTLVFLLLAVSVGASVTAVWMTRVAEGAQRDRHHALDREQEARARQREADDARLESINSVTDLYTSHGVLAGDQGNPARALLWFANAARQAGGHDPQREQMNRLRVRTWSRLVPLPLVALPHEDARVTHLAFHPTGQYLLTVSWAELDVLITTDPALPSIGRNLLVATSIQDILHFRVFDGTGAVLADVDETALKLDARSLDALRSRIRDLLPPHKLAEKEKEELRMQIAAPVLQRRWVSCCSVWDTETGERLPGSPAAADLTCATWSPGGEWLAVASYLGEVRLLSFPSGREEIRLPAPQTVNTLAFSPDSRWLAVAGWEVRLWDVRARRYATPELTTGCQFVRTLTWNAAGTRLAVDCRDNTTRVYALSPEPDRPTPLFTVPHRGKIQGSFQDLPAIFIDGDRGLLTVTEWDKVHWWDADSGQRLHTLPFVSPKSRAQVHWIAADATGSRFAVGGFSGAQLYDTRRAAPVGDFLPHGNHVTALAFSPDPDDPTLFTASEDRTGQLWSVPAGSPLFSTFPHQAPVLRAVFAPNGQSVATLQNDGLVRVWGRPPGHPEDHTTPRLGGAPTFARLSPDGRYVLASGAGPWEGTLHTTRVYDSATGTPVGTRPLDPGGLILDAALSPDGARAATACSLVTRDERKAVRLEPDGRAGRVQLWDWRRGEALFDPVLMPSEPRGVAFSPDGSLVACIGAGGQIRLVDTATGQVNRALEIAGIVWAENTYPAVRFTPDGRTLLAWGCDSRLCAWEVATGRSRYTLQHEGLCYAVSFSPDHRLLVTASWDRTARVWDLESGVAVSEPLVHPEWVFCACFSPDGESVLTGCRDWRARVWDWRTGRKVGPPVCRHGDAVFSAAYLSDPRFVVTGSRDNTSRIWEVRSGKPVTPAYPFGGWVWNALLTPDGNRVILAGWSDTLVSRHLGDLAAADTLDVDDLCLLSEVLSGQRLQGEDVEGLTTEEWLERWRTFRQRHPDLRRTLRP